ncbi:hypothetical protein HQ37_05150 [Porphyromonas sp. COT-239 OH1446]|nr:hypothetical protein HQ37_05150 [Porphyromonas sp. COT-239 OH1446]
MALLPIALHQAPIYASIEALLIPRSKSYLYLCGDPIYTFTEPLLGSPLHLDRGLYRGPILELIRISVEGSAEGLRVDRRC